MRTPAPALRLCLVPLVAAAALTACQPKAPAATTAGEGGTTAAPKPRPQAEAPREVDTQWAEVQQAREDDTRSLRVRAMMLRAFAKKFPDDPRAKQALLQAREIDPTPSIGAATKRVHDALGIVRADVYRERVMGGPLVDFFVYALTEAPETGPDGAPDLDKAPFSPTTLRRPDGKTLTLKAPRRFGPATARVAATTAAQALWPDQARCDRWETPCQHRVLQAVAREKLKAPLWRAPGVVNPQTLDKLLSAAWLDPETPILGTTARALYLIHRPAIVRYLRAYKVIAPQRAAILSDYRAALARHPKDLLHTTHAATATRLKLAAHAQLGAEAHQAPAIAGFWTRRMADGSAPTLITHARKLLLVYEPELGAEVFGE